MKLFQKYVAENKKHTIYKFLGLKFKVKNTQNLEEQVKVLQQIVNIALDITKVPPARGKLRELQLNCLDLLKEFDSICKANNLQYWLDSGTLLGAVRHKGFVPWDDDIDVCMLRDDYEKILPILKEYYDETGFFVRERAVTMNNFQHKIMYRKNKKICLDIFPVDMYYKADLELEDKKEIDMQIDHARLVFDKEFKKKYFTPDEVQKAKTRLKEIRDKYILNNHKTNIANPALFWAIDYMYTPEKYKIFNNDMVFPLRHLEFEGNMLPCPNKPEEYLENIYGDYMAFPQKIYDV